MVTEDIALDSDLLNCPEHGIVIGSDNITVDMGGHTIDGDPEGFFDIGVDNSAGHDGVTIRNGTVREFDTGVAFLGTAGNIVEGLDVSTANFGDGILVDGFSYSGSRLNRIENNTIAGNGGNGIYLNGTSNNVITENAIRRNGIRGLQLFASSSNRFEKNWVSGNGGQGFALFESDGNRMTNNAVTGNVLGGFLIVDDADENVLERNIVSNNAFGIYIADSKRRPGAERNAVVENNIHDNAGDGIALRGPSHEPPFFPPAPGATETLLDGNCVSANGDDGIDVPAPTTTLSRNTAVGNADFGIEAVSGVTDGGRNRAYANGNPAQCLNVACGSPSSPNISSRRRCVAGFTSIPT